MAGCPGFSGHTGLELGGRLRRRSFECFSDRYIAAVDDDGSVVTGCLVSDFLLHRQMLSNICQPTKRDTYIHILLYIIIE